ncbi:solute carrier family 2, facilitated glucose transporter member 8-like [Dermacentor variabilis]|uniref:solute carrier family 2, facilitated glucose transporter member 8-like n=1 Tax=Dermacentor variabilis TaxID=34621 RepID=UPI003F5C5380
MCTSEYAKNPGWSQSELRSSASAASAASAVGRVSELTENASNRAMEALRNLQPPAKGGSPVTDNDRNLMHGMYVRAMLTACLGSCVAGTTLGFASVAMSSIEREPWYNLADSEPGNHWLADSLVLGAAGGALFSGLPLWCLGSRKTILACAVGLSVSWIVLAASFNLVVLFLARVLCGLWLGIITIGVSLYAAEVAPVKKRAFYTGLTEAATCFGIAMTYMLDGISWRLQATLWATVSLSLLGVERYLIECPLWLRARGRHHESDAAAARLYGMVRPPELRRGSKVDVGAAAKAPVQNRALARRLCTCLALHLLQGASLMQLFLCRGMQTMASVVDEVAAPLAALLMTSMQAVFVVVFASLTRITGRRHLLFVSTALIAICFASFQPFDHLIFRQWSLQGVQFQTSWKAVYSVNLLVLSYSVGLCHLPSLLTAELFPGAACLHYVGAPVVWAVRWLLAFVVLHYGHELVTFARKGHMALMAAAALVMMCGVLVAIMPETEDRTLAEIEKRV